MQGVSYLSPISPFDIKSQNYAIIRKSNNKIKNRPLFLKKERLIINEKNITFNLSFFSNNWVLEL